MEKILSQDEVNDLIDNMEIIISQDEEQDPFDELLERELSYKPSRGIPKPEINDEFFMYMYYGGKPKNWDNPIKHVLWRADLLDSVNCPSCGQEVNPLSPNLLGDRCPHCGQRIDIEFYIT